MSRRALLTVILLLLAGCSLQQNVGDRADAGGSNAGAAPALQGSALTGGSVDLAADRGHVVLVDFWASWCGPCRAEQADINALCARYQPRGVRCLGVDMRDDDAEGRAYEASLHVPYPSVPDADESVAAAWDVTAPPTIVVVDQQGTLAGRFLGTVVGIDTLFDRLLAAR